MAGGLEGVMAPLIIETRSENWKFGISIVFMIANISHLMHGFHGFKPTGPCPKKFGYIARKHFTLIMAPLISEYNALII